MPAMCFDTTSLNTKKNRACAIVNKIVDRDLLHLAGRHLIVELIGGAAFKTAIPTNSAPQALLFKRFKEKWDRIDQESFEDSYTKEKALKVVVVI